MDPKTMWGSGNYAAVAEKITDSAERLVEASAVEPGMEVLDVACGTGNVAIPAVKAGARVTGVDFSPDLLAIARERAADAMVEVEWVEADAQEHPFPEASFDRVLSAFGHMFAPDHERTAAEMKRVCRPGGAIGICCWSPTGAVGRMFGAMARLVPPPPDTSSPLLWGTEEHVRELLGEARFERHEIEWREASVEAYADFMLESFGPLLSARETLGERAGELRSTYVDYLSKENLADDGTLRFRGEYLLSVIPRP
jgi:ubiquinone/menaquinone biosynthesis C-methylase UbiE